MSAAQHPMTTDQVARIFGCTAAQARAQYAANAVQLFRMAAKAAVTGHKVNGYTEAELRAYASAALDRSKA